MWEDSQERPDFVLQNMVGANIDFIIIKVDRESGFAIASRRMAARSQRYGGGSIDFITEWGHSLAG